MYGMTNYGKLFDDELTNGIIDESGFNQSKEKLLYITSMKHMATSYLCYVMLMTVYIGIHMRN